MHFLLFYMRFEGRPQLLFRLAFQMHLPHSSVLVQIDRKIVSQCFFFFLFPHWFDFTKIFLMFFCVFNVNDNTVDSLYTRRKQLSYQPSNIYFYIYFFAFESKNKIKFTKRFGQRSVWFLPNFFLYQSNCVCVCVHCWIVCRSVHARTCRTIGASFLHLGSIGVSRLAWWHTCCSCENTSNTMLTSVVQ